MNPFKIYFYLGENKSTLAVMQDAKINKFVKYNTGTLFIKITA